MGRGEALAQGRTAKRPATPPSVVHAVGEVRAPAGDALELEPGLRALDILPKPLLEARTIDRLVALLRGGVAALASLVAHGGQSYAGRRRPHRSSGGLRRGPDHLGLGQLRRLLP